MSPLDSAIILIKVKCMDKALLTMINNMPEKTGKKLEEWLQILHKENIEKHSTIFGKCEFTCIEMC